MLRGLAELAPGVNVTVGKDFLHVVDDGVDLLLSGLQSASIRIGDVGALEAIDPRSLLLLGRCWAFCVSLRTDCDVFVLSLPMAANPSQSGLHGL